MSQASMIRARLASFFDKSPVIHYIKQHACETIGDVVVDVANIALRRYACDGSHCLTLQALPNPLDDYGFTFYNEVAVYGDCCRGPVVFISGEERRRIAAHLDGIVPHMSPEGQFVVKENLRTGGGEAREEAFAEAARGKVPERRELDFAKMHTLWGDQCVFRTVHHDGQRGQVRCAIHAYAAQSGVSYLDVKPTDCWFWPLALVPLYTGQFFLTVHTEETRHFTEESASYAKKRCLTEPIAGAPYIYESFRDELVYVFGQAWFDALRACARRHQGHADPAGGAT